MPVTQTLEKTGLTLAQSGPRHYLLGNICSAPERRWRLRHKSDALGPEYQSDVLFVDHEMMWPGHDNNTDIMIRCWRMSQWCQEAYYLLILLFLSYQHSESVSWLSLAPSCDWWVHYPELRCQLWIQYRNTEGFEWWFIFLCWSMVAPTSHIIGWYLKTSLTQLLSELNTEQIINNYCWRKCSNETLTKFNSINTDVRYFIL